MLKNKRRIWLAAAFLWAVQMIPAQARAYEFSMPDVYNPATGHVCPISNSFDPAPSPGNNFSNSYSAANLEKYGLTKRIVLCVKGTVLAAVYAFLVPFSDYMATTVAACITLAILLWGALMVTGKTSAPVRDLLVTAVKIGAVLMFSWNFNGWFEIILDSMEWMLGVVTAYMVYSPTMSCPNATSNDSMIVWERVDCTIQTLLGGIFPFAFAGMSTVAASNTVFYGLTAFLLLSFFSGSIGVIIALAGFWLILQFLFTLARALYIFVCAYLAFAVMILISPIFVPLILFKVTRAFFEKWLKTTIGFILQPIFLFAYLSMLLAAFDVVVYSGNHSLFKAITGTHFGQNVMTPHGPEPFAFGNALYYSSGAYADSSQSSVGFRVDSAAAQKALGTPQKLDSGVVGVVGEEVTSEGIWQGDVFSYLGTKNFFKVDAPTKAINWNKLALWANSGCTSPGGQPGYCTTLYMINLVLSFLMALIASYIFFTLLDFLPFVGTGITAEPLSTAPFGMGQLGPPGEGFIGNVKKRIAAPFGL